MTHEPDKSAGLFVQTDDPVGGFEYVTGADVAKAGMKFLGNTVTSNRDRLAQAAENTGFRIFTHDKCLVRDALVDKPDMMSLWTQDAGKDHEEFWAEFIKLGGGDAY